jgi:hypothetical protein
MPVTVDLSAAVVTVVVVAVGGPLQWNTLGGVDDGTGATSIKRGSESADDCHCWVGEKAASEVDGRCL